MKISRAMAGIQRIYIEAAPLIYYVEENPTYIMRFMSLPQLNRAATLF
jgi:hypothetical protein